MFTDSIDSLAALDGENQTWVFPGHKPFVGTKGNYMLSPVPVVYIIKWVLQPQMKKFTTKFTSLKCVVKSLQMTYRNYLVSKAHVSNYFPDLL